MRHMGGKRVTRRHTINEPNGDDQCTANERHARLWSKHGRKEGWDKEKWRWIRPEPVTFKSTNYSLAWATGWILQPMIHSISSSITNVCGPHWYLIYGGNGSIVIGSDRQLSQYRSTRDLEVACSGLFYCWTVNWCAQHSVNDFRNHSTMQYYCSYHS